jgi:hypothetical protein
MTNTTRRAALTALAGVPALAIPALGAGSPSTASPDHPDAEVFVRLKAGHQHPDVVAAEARRNALRSQWGELAERLAETPEKTVDAMIAKLAMVAIDMVYDEEDCLSGDYDGIAASAALDAVRLRATAKA